MRLRIVFWLATAASSAAFGQVSIENFNPDTGLSTVASGPTQATFSTPYTLNFGGAQGSAVTVIPSATANLATASFFDGMSIDGTYVPNCGCSGGLAAYLPTLSLRDSFVLTGTTAQVIPWSFSMVVTPQFLSASARVFDNVINQILSIGGGAPVFTGYGTQKACFDSINPTGGCGAPGPSGPNNTPYTLSFSGTISSGGTLTFSAQTSGSISFIAGPGVSSVQGAFALDPTLRLTVPAGVTVVSSSGVFPVSVVPEMPRQALLLAGLSLMIPFVRLRRRAG